MSATTISSIRAIAWKEWRDQRLVFIMGIVISALLPLFLAAGSMAFKGTVDITGIAETFTVVLAFMVWPLFTVAVGAGIIALETEHGTLGFILTRPISRWRLWGVKVLLGATIVVGIVACSAGISWALRSLAGTLGVTPLENLGGLDDFEGLATVLPAGVLLVLFAWATFFSTFLPRVITAAAAAIGGTLAFLTLTFAFWSRLDLDPVSVQETLVVHFVGTSLILLGASLTLFGRREIVMSRREPILAGLIVVAVLIMSPALAVAWLTPLSADAAWLRTFALSPAGDAIAVTASRPDGGSPRVWLMHADGSGTQRLTPRLTMDPAFSPDGHWIAYLSRHSWTGLASDGVSLRAIRADGSGDHLVAAAGTPADDFWRADPVFSPDGSRVAFVNLGRLIVGAIGAHEEITVDLGGSAVSGGHLVGWTRDGREVLVESAWFRSEGGMAIVAIDPSTLRLRTLWETSRAPVFTGRLSVASGWRDVPLILKDDEDGTGNDLVLVRVEDGLATTVASGVCPGSVSMLDSGDALAWAHCRGEKRAPHESEIMIRDLQTGEQRRLATIRGEVFRMMLSPSLEHVSVIRRFDETREESIRTIVGPEGKTTDLKDTWVPVGWSGRSRLTVLDQESGQLATVDAVSGDLRGIRL